LQAQFHVGDVASDRVEQRGLGLHAAVDVVVVCAATSRRIVAVWASAAALA